jgi:hypothetical protein
VGPSPRCKWQSNETGATGSACARLVGLNRVKQPRRPFPSRFSPIYNLNHTAVPASNEILIFLYVKGIKGNASDKLISILQSKTLEREKAN